MERTAHIIFNAKAILGEGAIWHPRESLLYWVDIEGKELHRYNPSTGGDAKMELPQRVGSVVPIKKGGMLVGMEDCIAKVEFEKKNITSVSPLEENQSNTRCNDGKCDPNGRFWIGTMDLQERQGMGNLYKIDCKLNVTKVLDNLSVSNGIVWSRDKKTMYFIDSPTYSVQAFNYDNETGEISNQRTVIEVPSKMGAPDGMTIDEKGMLWIAHWGGFCVGRWNPDKGNLKSKVTVPVPNVTSCAFGGSNLDTLFITTAKAGLSPEELEKYPESGGLFAVSLDIRGVPANIFMG